MVVNLICVEDCNSDGKKPTTVVVCLIDIRPFGDDETIPTNKIKPKICMVKFCKPWLNNIIVDNK